MTSCHTPLHRALLETAASCSGFRSARTDGARNPTSSRARRELVDRCALYPLPTLVGRVPAAAPASNIDVERVLSFMIRPGRVSRPLLFAELNGWTPGGVSGPFVRADPGSFIPWTLAETAPAVP